VNLRFPNLLRWKGEIARGPFLVWGVLLFALKYNLDRLLLNLAFGRDWSVFNYFERPVVLLDVSPAQAPGEYGMLLAVALPFLWAGMALCVKRLRSAKLPLWLAVLFVVPIVKGFLFLMLLILPERREDQEKTVTGDRRARTWERWFPKSNFGSAGRRLEHTAGGGRHGVGHAGLERLWVGIIRWRAILHGLFRRAHTCRAAAPPACRKPFGGDDFRDNRRHDPASCRI